MDLWEPIPEILNLGTGACSPHEFPSYTVTPVSPRDCYFSVSFMVPILHSFILVSTGLPLCTHSIQSQCHCIPSLSPDPPHHRAAVGDRAGPGGGLCRRGRGRAQPGWAAAGAAGDRLGIFGVRTNSRVYLGGSKQPRGGRWEGNSCPGRVRRLGQTEGCVVMGSV